VRLIGLTGGIGSGKSTVARMLAERGAVIVDADAIAREVVEPGHPAFEEVVRRFGPGILLPDGTLDRAQLASLVFADDSSRAALNDIVHPEVGREVAARIEAYRDTDAVVVVDIPLMVESGGTAGFDAVLVVSAPGWQRIERLARDRAMSDSDVRARIASQASDEQRKKIATHVIENTGTIEQLEGAVDRFWRDVVAG